MTKRTLASGAGTIFVLAIALYGCPDSDDTGGTPDGGASSSSSGGSSSGGSSSGGSSSGGVDAGPTCTDAKKNGLETDVDCGGGTCPKCAVQKGCNVGTDCTTGLCDKNVCVDPSCTDKKKNADETDVDCGGTKCAGCTDGLACLKASDCESKNCGPSNTCLPPTADDGIQNGTETDVDCGGGAPTNAPKCATGKKCKVVGDCDKALCTGGTCAPPANNDGIQNGTETDVDCGGGAPTNAPKCATGKMCGDTSDCNNVLCTGGVCDPPTATDGLKNGTETDVDCGGAAPTNAPKCKNNRACGAGADCLSRTCAGAVCIPASCGQGGGNDGITTCGKGEVGAGGAVHESCCKQIELPGDTVLMDKYKVTAGRMRKFLTAVGNNAAGWYAANKANLPAATQAQIDPYVAYLPSNVNGYPYGVNYQLGGFIYLPNSPSASQGCYVGNAGSQGYGTHTYDNGNFDGDNRAFTQAFLDRLPLNCQTYPMAAVFCAWDGGRLQTYPESQAAYGAGTYSDGVQAQVAATGNLPGGFRNVPAPDGPWTQVGPATAGFTQNACPTCNVTWMNWSMNYQNPNGGVGAKPWDLAYFISPPGRFQTDVGPAGHMDVAGVMMELTATTNGNQTTQDYDGNTITEPRVRWSMAGSFEGHQVRAGYNFAVRTKYGKVGMRCVQD
ncbi:MAG: hypothetical protein JNL38_40550 [Myxococcales bacterium]|nr:hypothetical protein [Myxococcales bacterium]